MNTLDLNSLWKSYSKVLGLLLMMILGVAFPQFHVFAPFIQYLLMIMLFFAFLDINIQPQAFQKGVVWLVLANLMIGFAAYRILLPLDLNLALVAFITGIAPTATAAPVIISFINGQVEYVVGATLLTNVTMALILPFALPMVVGELVQISVWQVLRPVLITMFAPLLLAQCSRWLSQKAQQIIRSGRKISFPLWLLALFTMSANAGNFLRHDVSASVSTVFTVALVSLAICVIDFGLGAVLGGERFRLEASQSLGQKNNAFVIWIALTFINPLVAMGPTFYILYHNLYNSWQIYRFEKRRAEHGNFH